jgi:hypothetical protein
MLKKAGGYPVFLSDALLERAAHVAALPTSHLPGEKPSKNAVIRAAVRIGLDSLERGSVAVFQGNPAINEA